MSVADRVSFTMMSFYHETLYGLFRDPYRVLESAGVSEGQQVLEVGCGPGFFTVPAAEIVGEKGSVHAIDISPVAVNHVKKKVIEYSVDNVTVLQVDADRTEFSQDQFDLVFVFGLARAKGK